MDQYQNSSEQRDPELWELARRRASFKTHLGTYIVINIFLWVLWLITDSKEDHSGIPWPVWSTVGWGLGVIFHYMGAYVFPKSGSVENEYRKLKDQNK
jgi:hypothetical protein